MYRLKYKQLCTRFLNLYKIKNRPVFYQVFSRFTIQFLLVFLKKILKMKFKAILFAVAISVSTLAFAQETSQKKVSPPPGNALVGDTYGAGVNATSESKAITVDKLSKKLKKENKKLENVAIKGKVTDVCEKKGCWLTIQTEDNSQFFVKMKDYAFFVPTALKGKNVVLDGTAERKVISVDEQKHYAEDAKKPQSEIDAITKPQEEIRFVANGIKVVN